MSQDHSESWPTFLDCPEERGDRPPANRLLETNDKDRVSIVLPAAKAPQHVVEDVDRLRRHAGARPHGRRAAPRTGVVGAEDKPKRVDEEQPRSAQVSQIIPQGGG